MSRAYEVISIRGRSRPSTTAVQYADCSHTDGARHDCVYVDARNAVVEHVEADMAAAGWRKTDPLYTQTFLKNVARACQEAGLTS